MQKSQESLSRIPYISVKHLPADFTTPTQNEVIKILWASYTCQIDEEKTQVTLFHDGKLIGKMYAWSFWLGDNKYDHNGIEVEEEFRWKWFATLLYNIFTHRLNFWRLKEEFCSQSDMYYFYVSRWYLPVEVYKKESWELVISEDDLEDIDISSYLNTTYAIKLRLQK